MALEEYRRKRDFKKTPEPPPGQVKTRKAELSYLIQKHDATRLHYDFRLELDGVLLSWRLRKAPASIRPTRGWQCGRRIILSYATSKGPYRRDSMAAAQS
jgi:bifunctional non-homologous end joining protein LigD